MRLHWLAAMLVAAAGPAMAQDAADSPVAAQGAAGDEAIAAIALPEEQLRGLLARVIFDAGSMRRAAEAMGIAPFCAATLPAVDAAVEAHLPAWRANLVKAYRDSVPADVLETAVAQDAKTAASTIGSHMDAVGEAMHKASSPLLKQAATEVVEAVNREAAGYDINAVDMEKRRAELRAGAQDGSTFCGLFGRPRPQSRTQSQP